MTACVRLRGLGQGPDTRGELVTGRSAGGEKKGGKKQRLTFTHTACLASLFVCVSEREDEWKPEP